MRIYSQLIVSVLLGTCGSLVAHFLVKKYYVTIPVGFSSIALLFILFYVHERFPKILGVKGSFAATGIVFYHDEILVVWHKIQKKWIPPGSHVKRHQLPHELVIQKVKEEAGYMATFHNIHKKEHHLDRYSKTVPQPFTAQIEYQLPQEGHVYHYDFFYILKVSEKNNLSHGNTDHKWIKIIELEELVERGETYPDVLRVVQEALQIIN